VDAWLSRCASGLAREELLRLFQAALDALWARTHVTLGEVTLTAITERVLYNASEKFPFLSSVRVEPERGVRCRELGERLGALDAAELLRGVRFVLVEFLPVIGNLTAEILTPELHAELAGLSSSGPHGEQRDE
jgi:hypothetical protein